MERASIISRKRATRLPEFVRIVREGVLPIATKIRQPEDAVAMLRPLMDCEEVETFWVLSLDAQSFVRNQQLVTRGLVNSSLVHPREVFRVAIAAGACGIIVAHNHPSGDPTPSAEDRAVTRQLVSGGELLDIPVFDHLILGHDRFVSFAEAGLL